MPFESTRNFLFQLENIRHVRHLPDIFRLQNALIHFFQNIHKGENYTVRQFLDQPELSGAVRNSIMLGDAWRSAAVICAVEPMQELPIKAAGAGFFYSGGGCGNLGKNGGLRD